MGKRKVEESTNEVAIDNVVPHKKLAGEAVADDSAAADQAGLADIAKKILRPSAKVSQDAPILARDKSIERKLEAAKQEHKEKRLASEEKRKKLEKGHVVPDLSTRNYERGLAKIATRGVVKLFNSVRKQQRELEEKLDSVTEGKKAKVTASVLSKGKFLDMLKEGAAQTSAGDSKTGAEGGRSVRSTWLSNDFMMGAKLKDWDREDVASDADENADVAGSDLSDDGDDDGDDEQR